MINSRHGYPSTESWDERFRALKDSVVDLEASVAVVAAAAHRSELASERVMGAVEALERRMAQNGMKTYSTPPNGMKKIEDAMAGIWWRISRTAMGALLGAAVVAIAGLVIHDCNLQASRAVPTITR